MEILTVVLILTTCNTWTGVCSDPERVVTHRELPSDQIRRTAHVAQAIEDCRAAGVQIAKAKNNEPPMSTNVACEWAIERGA